jgi:hypothetical protein
MTAASDAFRVLRPGGRLIATEHVRSPVRAVHAVQRVLDPLSVRFSADHLTREPVDYLADVGFDIDGRAVEMGDRRAPRGTQARRRGLTTAAGDAISHFAAVAPARRAVSRSSAPGQKVRRLDIPTLRPPGRR